MPTHKQCTQISKKINVVDRRIFDRPNFVWSAPEIAANFCIEPIAGIERRGWIVADSDSPMTMSAGPSTPGETQTIAVMNQRSGDGLEFIVSTAPSTISKESAVTTAALNFTCTSVNTDNAPLEKIVHMDCAVADFTADANNQTIANDSLFANVSDVVSHTAAVSIASIASTVSATITTSTTSIPRSSITSSNRDYHQH